MVWIRAATLGSYVEVARSLGLDPGRMLWRAGINPALLADPERLIAGRAAVLLLETSAREAGCPHFGLMLAERRELATFGAVGLLLQHEETVGDALAAIVRYRSLLTEILEASIEEYDDSVIMYIGLSIEFDHETRQSVELATASVAHVLKLLAGAAGRPESIHFAHPAPGDLGVHQRAFDCPLEFESSFTGLVLARETLAVPIQGCDPGLRRYAREYLDLLLRPAGSVAIEERIRRSLLVLLPMGRGTLDQVSEDLGLHPRGVQRQLEKDGLTFARVLGEARRELAIRYLRAPDLPLNAVAMRIGFATPSSFTRWFRTEFGVPPQVWRSATTGEREAA